MTLVPPEKSRILLVEDDVKLAALVREYLQGEGFRVETEYRGDRAVERILEQPPDLVVLDLMLPGLDGFEVCRRVRRDYHGPILMLTARTEEIDEVLGLEIGADDYMSKPVKPRLLSTRLRALLRRVPAGAGAERTSKGEGAPATIRLTDLEIDAAHRSVTLAGEPVYLTTAEFDFLWFLARRAGEIVTRDELFEEVMGIPYDGLDRAADLRITRLRKKLGDGGKEPQRIKSIRGIGYLLAP